MEETNENHYKSVLSQGDSEPLEEYAQRIAAHYQALVKPGSGLFFDFKATPDVEQAVLNCLIQSYGWTLEKPFFIRKPSL